MDDKMYPFRCIDCRFKENCIMSLVGKSTNTYNLNNTQIQYLRRQTLCKEGEFSSSMKLLIEGLAMVLIEGPDKKNLVVNILKPGDFLGFSAICGEDTYSFSAIALTDTLVCSIGRPEIVNLIRTDGDFAFNLAQWYCKSYKILFNKLKVNGFRNLQGRLADTVLTLDNYSDYNIYKYLTRKDIADFAGMPMESAVRILSEFNENKLISLQGKSIEILDRKRLEIIAKNG
ncbi:MAG: Crp/Fnr family transcriptional regulator [Bacteroidales bacterium]|nr:Crp/Fnr family transcriptional regulator [Bacteroidales bacterium]